MPKNVISYVIDYFYLAFLQGDKEAKDARDTRGEILILLDWIKKSHAEREVQIKPDKEMCSDRNMESVTSRHLREFRQTDQRNYQRYPCYILSRTNFRPKVNILVRIPMDFRINT